MHFSRRAFLTATGASLLRAQSAGKPNVVLIVADDLAAWMLGCYGSKEIRTPNIDRLAKAGTRFLYNFVCTPSGSPSRATLFSGRTPAQHGIFDFLTANPVATPPQGQKDAPASFASEVLLSDVLAGQGYNCGYIGKWNMGNDRKPGHGLTYTCTAAGNEYENPTLFENGEERKEPGYLTELLTAKAAGFLDRQTPDKPFFLTLGYLNPHTPYTGHPQKYYDLYKNSTFETVGFETAAPNLLRHKEFMADMLGNMRKAAAAVTALDDQIPVLQKKLMAKGLWENTIILLTSDNGFLHGRHGLWTDGLASDPINMYEEVMQVPLLWSWPGRIPVDAVRPEIVSFYDVMPTLCELTGAPLPAGRKLVGHSYAGLLQGKKPAKKAKSWNNMVFGQFRNTEMARDQYYKLVQRNNGAGPNELFDLKLDPRERVNRFEDPGYVTIRERLAKSLQAWKDRA